MSLRDKFRNSNNSNLDILEWKPQKPIETTIFRSDKIFIEKGHTEGLLALLSWVKFLLLRNFKISPIYKLITKWQRAIWISISIKQAYFYSKDSIKKRAYATNLKTFSSSFTKFLLTQSVMWNSIILPKASGLKNSES